MKVNTSFITLESPQGSMEVYVAHPREFHIPKVVIVFQEAFGVNGHIQDICHRLAHEGYYVLAPELFHRQGKHVTFEYHDKPKVMEVLKGLKNSDVKADLQVLWDYIQQLENVDVAKVATMGFCIGGYTSILAAIHFPLITAISFYGAGQLHKREGIALEPLRDSLAQIKCPVLQLFGDEDSSIPLDEVAEIEAEYKRQQVELKSVIFTESNHGFFCGQRGSYNPTAAHAAWELCLKWLKEYMTDYSSPEKSSSAGSGFSSADRSV